MRVGIEVSPLVAGTGGIPTYVTYLLQGLGQVDTENEYFLYTNRPVTIKPALPDNFTVRLVTWPYYRFQLWFQMALPLRFKSDRIDVFHATFHRFPLALTVPGVLTVYDLSGCLTPEHHIKKVRLLNSMLPLHFKQAEEIIAVSEFTASEVKRFAPSVSEKISVIPEAAAPDLSRVRDRSLLDRTRRELDLPRRFMLFLGTLEPRKNLPRLLQAYTRVSEDIPHHLVMSGSKGWKSAPIFEGIRQAGLAEKVHITGYVEDEMIPALLSMADFLVYPSLYEGFGLPVIEAMACGTPVVCSNAASVPEVAGKAALLADPLSVEDMAVKLRRMALDDDLRSSLSDMGLKRADQFSWADTARRTIEVYRKAAGR
ncbi:glycosyltransferase [Candidatus Fermentibacteria bacterium]|nr:glycosyltransferase [Candidatus Fermentibacteria bacterium]